MAVTESLLNRGAEQLQGPSHKARPLSAEIRGDPCQYNGNRVTLTPPIQPLICPIAMPARGRSGSDTLSPIHSNGASRPLPPVVAP